MVQPMGVVTLRLGFAALILCVLWRPALPRDRRSLALVLAWGTAIAGMNTIYPALEHLPVGAAASLQFLGPLAVALGGSRRWHDLVWVALTGTGVFLLYSPSGSAMSLSGTLLALTSGGAWAAYIILTRRFGSRTADGSMLALAVTWAALLTVPAGIVATGPALMRPAVLLAGLGIALVSAVVPWSFDLAALRRLPSGVFGVLVSLEPAVGGVAGLLLLGEQLTGWQWLAIGCIVAASMGVARRGRR